MSQLAIPVDVTPEEIGRKKTLGDAISLCVDVSGMVPKQLQDRCGFDKAQFSRWESGGEGVVWPKLVSLMDACGNDAPLLWMLAQRGYDLRSVRKIESELERQLREAKEMNAALVRAMAGMVQRP